MKRCVRRDGGRGRTRGAAVPPRTGFAGSAWARAMGAVLLAASTAGAQDVADVFADVHSSVVTIRSVKESPHGDPGSKASAEVLVGSGVLLTEGGEILTAAHVVKLADRIEVTFVDGTVLPARVIASEPVPDLALLEIQGLAPPAAVPARLGDSDHVRVGSRVMVIGAPLNMEHTLTVGYVSARRRSESFLGSMQGVEHFQTDAAINKGNSGGPLFSMGGEVIGVVCHIVSESGGSEGLGFAVTSNAVRDLLLSGRHVWLGFDSIPLPLAFSRALNVPGGRTGLLVQQVAQGSPAESMGLQGGTIPIEVGGREILLGGDVILSILDLPLGTLSEIEAAIQSILDLPSGGRLRMEVLRGGRIHDLSGMKMP